MTSNQELITKARTAVNRLRDFAREHGMHFRERDPLVMDIHNAIDALDRLAAPPAGADREP